MEIAASNRVEVLQAPIWPVDPGGPHLGYLATGMTVTLATEMVLAPTARLDALSPPLDKTNPGGN
jgi:hypothetical protein